MFDDRLKELPQGWIQTTLGEVKLDLSQNIRPNDFPDEQFELYSVPSYDCGVPDILYGREIGSNKQIVSKNSVLLCKINPKINRVWIVGDYSHNRKIASTEWIVFNSVTGLDPEYLCYFMRDSKFRDYLTSNVSGVGGSLTRIRPSLLDDYTLPLAPLAEQQRIVKEIDRQVAELEIGITNLKDMMTKLKKLRKETLKAACEGKLVPNESKLAFEGEREYESGAQLLERILKERHRKWELDQRTKMQIRGQEPKDNKWKSKYQEPAMPDTTNLPELPQGWIWTLTQQLGEIQLGRQRAPQNISKHYPTKYIRAANITENGLDLSDVLEMEFEPHERERYYLQDGDIVLSEASGSPTQVGKPAVWRNQIPECCFQNTVIRLRPTFVLSDYLLIVFKNYYTNGIFSKIAGGLGINHLSLDKFSKIAVALPPLIEQQQIIDEINKQSSLFDVSERAIQENLKYAEELRQIMLNQAFEGRLVPQDPNDENAILLLERIKTERQQREKEEKQNRKVGRKTMKKVHKSTERRKLTEVLKEVNQPMRPEELFREAGFKPEEVEEFYAELKAADAIKAFDEEKQENGDVYLKAKA